MLRRAGGVRLTGAELHGDHDAAEARRQGTVRSGALVLLLPYRAGRFTAKELARARAGAVVEDGERALIPLPNGTYEVARHR